MNVHTLDPMRDTRWAEFVARHERSSVFHSLPWLEAVRRTYGYRPVVYTTSPPSSPLSNGIVLCQVRSWLTGRRMVSVPFSDHCEPLVDDAEAAATIGNQLQQAVDSGKWKYVELRPKCSATAFPGAWTTSDAYLHVLDLRPDAEELFHCTHKSCVQRKIHRAERERLTYEAGNSERLLKAFYRLLIQTRRKHQLPPQPIQWFRNLVACMGDKLNIRVMMKEGREIASIITLQHKDVVVYKYGCSDAAFHGLGGTHALLWNTILEAKSLGLTKMDFGRSDIDNPGLIAFKERWGAKPLRLTQVRWSHEPWREATGSRRRPFGFAKPLVALMPDAVLRATGRILYRHVG